ncbi:mycothione reductase [Nocardioides sp. AE5]|uniref:mycothione reductase n=1 Tax=Nocardioides sp. AE5 TaxID=2962573 RepID=UPI00288203AE|nr:mycothione reductase [Nocardioides sp. AE5]MDT0202828.1 mycothione reductase [Nocardioides sp. AE5]
MTHFDIAVIGAGSGNFLMNRALADKQFAVIEEGLFGGTCLNVGCIPTKMFVHAAEVADQVRDAARLGIDANLAGVRWGDIRDRVFDRIDPYSASARQARRDGPNTTVYAGHARFTGDHTLLVATDAGEEEVSADTIVIAAGARATVPPELADVPFHTSDTVMRIDALPRTATIIGGGFIAAEFAHILSGLGVEVTIVNRGPALLRRLDDDLRDAYTALAQEQWTVHLGRTVASATSLDDPDRSGAVALDLDDGTRVETDLLLVATGRVPNSDRLGLEATGIEVHPDGRIKVDERGRTSVDGVLALGDISSPYQLKHVANHEARTIAHNLANPDDQRSFDHRFVPSAVFTRPQIATVGLTEAAAREAGHDVVTSTRAYGDTAYGWALEDTTGLCKVIADRGTGLLLGAHVMGPDASTLIQPAIQALSFGLPAPEMARGQYWIHPAMAEVLENAVLGLRLR